MSEGVTRVAPPSYTSSSSLASVTSGSRTLPNKSALLTSTSTTLPSSNSKCVSKGDTSFTCKILNFDIHPR